MDGWMAGWKGDEFPQEILWRCETMQGFFADRFQEILDHKQSQTTLSSKTNGKIAR